MKQREAKIPDQAKIRITEALERLVQLYDAMGKKEQAAQWRKKLEAHRLKIGPELPPYREEKKQSRETTPRTQSKS